MGFFKPPHSEEDIVGKWYGAIYKSGLKKMVYVGKFLRRFLADPEGPVESLEIHCTKPRWDTRLSLSHLRRVTQAI